MDNDDDDDHMDVSGGDNDDNEDDFDFSVSHQRGPMHKTIDQFAFDDNDVYEDAGAVNAAVPLQHPRPISTLSGAADQLVPFHVVAGRDPNAVRPEAAVVDRVSYLNQVAFLALLHGHATQGMPAPLFDAERQTMVTNKLHFHFYLERACLFLLANISSTHPLNRR